MPLKLFEGAMIQRGKFHIPVNTLNKSQNLVTKHSKEKKREKIDYWLRLWLIMNFYSFSI